MSSIDLDTAYIPEVRTRWCPTTRTSGWLELRYAPREPKLLNPRTDEVFGKFNNVIELSAGQ